MASLNKITSTVAERLAYQMYQTAQTKANIAQAQINHLSAIGNQNVNAPQWASGNAEDVPLPIEPDVEIPRVAQGAELAMFHIYSDAIIDKLVKIFRDYLDEFLPNECPYLEKAQLWICRVLSGKEPMGIPAHIEAQIWNRERDRILHESSRAKNDVVKDYAARGYPVPAGAMIKQRMILAQEAMGQIAQSSREIAIESAKIELENAKFAVEQAINMYGTAVGAAGEYIKALAMGPQLGLEVIPSVTDSQSRLIEAANSYYQSRIQVAKLLQENRQFNLEQANKAKSENATLTMEGIKTRIEAAIDAAKAAATLAASSLNSITAQASVSHSNNMGVGYNYSNDTESAPRGYEVIL